MSQPSHQDASFVDVQEFINKMSKAVGDSPDDPKRVAPVATASQTRSKQVVASAVNPSMSTHTISSESPSSPKLIRDIETSSGRLYAKGNYSPSYVFLFFSFLLLSHCWLNPASPLIFLL